ncbi:Accelerated cell death 11 [Stylosanthes scabra]|uniref:Accelerated cell death 11 n=1 Tax=Stylosanthes scabra TaxID=79078 RepID=A0ABU6YRR8_9FABA|nr:Accelerated cell death 11 [Stylosanthes scabra]
MAAPDGDDKPLQKISDAFKVLASVAQDSQSPDMELASFSRACTHVCPLFGCLGIAFKFAEKDFVAKVKDLAEASNSIKTLQSMIEQDVQNNCVRTAGSHTRNLLRVKRGLDMVRLLFEYMLVTEGSSLRDPASKAYEKALAPYHGWAIRKAVSAGLYTLPTKEQLLVKFNEDEAAARVLMQNYVTACTPVLQYVDNLFTSRDLGTDW